MTNISCEDYTSSGSLSISGLWCERCSY